MTVPKVDLSSPTQAISGISSGSAAKSGGVSVGAPSENPFSGGENFGVGLVRSDLSNFSYTLPNGETSTCNTICVG